MPPLFKLFRELDPSEMTQAVKVRLIRCYSLHVGDDVKNVYSLECVFHDAEGGRLHASIKRALIPRFAAMFREEHLYALKNFVLTNNTMKIKTSSSEYKMIFIPKTNVAEMFDPNFPRNVFEFKMYDDLSLWENFNEDLLIDVIGRLSSRSAKQIREVQGRETSMLDITLKNIQGNVITCTLWGHHADLLLNHIEGNDGPIVVIMQMCKIKKFRGEVRLCNTFNVSKVIFSNNVREIEDFHRGLALEGNNEIPVTNFAMPSSMSIREDLEMSRDKIINLDHLVRVHEIEHFWVYCKVVAIEPMVDWFYVSCKRCLKKMAPAGSTFYCVSCDKTDPVGNLRYRIQVRVSDNSGMATFILWDKECISMLGRTAGDLRSNSDGKVIPASILRILGTKGLFKVNVKDYSTGVNLGPFPVMKMTVDVDLISEYCDIHSLNDVEIEDNGLAAGNQAPVKAEKVKDEKVKDEKVKNEKVKTVPSDVCSVVKRNLMEEFGKNEDEKDAKRLKPEDF